MNCLICESSEVARFCASNERLLGIEGTFQTVSCSNCRFVFLHPRPGALEMKSYYPDNYYSYKKWRSHRSVFKSRWDTVKWKYLSRWNFVRPYGVPRYLDGGKVLDFGCGSGEVVHKLQSVGWDAYGLDINEEAVNFAQNNGLKVAKQDLSSFDFADEYFDLIRLHSVLEHLHEAHEFLEDARRLLKVRGSLLLVVPNIKSWSFGLFKSRWFNLDLPRHVYQFSLRSLQDLLELHGFEIVQKRTFSNAGFLGSLEYLWNEKRGGHGSHWRHKRWLRWLFFVLFDAWTIIFKKGDLIEMTAKKTGA